MEHNHSHHHHHVIEPQKMNTAFVVGIILNMAFVIIEVVAGLMNHSLALLSDAGHNLADVGALALSLFAFKMLKVKSTDHYTYGFRKTSILVALFNAVVLLISIGIIVYEAIQRLFNPQPVAGLTISLIAAIGIVINFASARMFFRTKERDMNVRAAYLHLMADAVVSLGIVLAGVAIFYSHLYWIDPAVSIIIAIVILISTWRLLKDSLRLTLDGVPSEIDMNEVKLTAMKVKGVLDLHHIHVWAISTAENALTAHLVLSPDTTMEEERKIKHELRHALEHQKIHHITLETERANADCVTEIC